MKRIVYSSLVGVSLLLSQSVLAAQSLQMTTLKVEVKDQGFCYQGEVSGKPEVKALKKFLKESSFKFYVYLGDTSDNSDSVSVNGLTSPALELKTLSESKDKAVIQVCAATSGHSLVDRTYANNKWYQTQDPLLPRVFGFTVATDQPWESSITLMSSSLASPDVSRLATIKREDTLFVLPRFTARVVNATTGLPEAGYTLETKIRSLTRSGYSLVLRGVSDAAGNVVLRPFAEYIDQSMYPSWETAPTLLLITDPSQFKVSSADLGSVVSATVRVDCYNSKFPVKECQVGESNTSFGDILVEALQKNSGVETEVDSLGATFKVLPK